MTSDELTQAISSGKATVETSQSSDSSQSAPTEGSSNKAAPEEVQSTIDQFIPILVALQSTQKFLSSAPTFTPQTFQDQFQFGYDGSVYRLYVWVNNTWQTVVLGGSLVQRILAGTGISVSPAGGTGIVTVNSTFQGKFAHGIVQWPTTNANGTQQIAHGLGVAPAFVRITSIAYAPTAGGPNIGGTGTYDALNNQTYSLWYGFDNGGGGTFSTDVTNIVTMSQTAGSQQSVASITVDSTNLNLAWVKTGTPNRTVQMLWEAWA